MARLLAALAILLIGILVGAYCQPVSSGLQAVFAPPETPAPTPTTFVLSPTRQIFPTPTSPLPPTLQRPVLRVPTSTPASHTFVIPLRGGGEMTVNANDRDAAINNVKS